MRYRSLALLILLALGSTAAFAAEPLRQRRDHRAVFQRIARMLEKVFGVTSHSDGLIPPRPSDPPKP